MYVKTFKNLRNSCFSPVQKSSTKMASKIKKLNLSPLDRVLTFFNLVPEELLYGGFSGNYKCFNSLIIQ